MTSIYLDHNASTPIDPTGRRPCGRFSIRPSAICPAVIGRARRRRLRWSTPGARSPDCSAVVPTRSEANNLAIKGTFFERRPKGVHIVAVQDN
ncbi:hypothetical protein [Rhizobium sp. LjRoot258]|uniref:hypothetical protein n=1 Tax=Rhizobium sp. LjRoot258 TaxID=3342299 RepID=UPI003ED16B38